MTFDPHRGRLLERGATLLFDSTEIPGEILDVLVVRQQALERSPRAVEALVRGWFATLAWMAEHPEEAAQWLGARLETDPAAVPAMLAVLPLTGPEENARFLLGTAPQLVAAAQRQRANLLRLGIINAEMDVEALIATPPLERALGAASSQH